MEKVTVYVAGNPDAYPVEYYDRGTKSFQGMIPELLRQFSQQSRYNIVYYAAGRRDQRERLARNRQVDVVSGLDGTEQLQRQAGEDIILLNTIWEGELVAYRLSLTDVAPETLRGDLENFLAGVAAETKTGLLIEAAQRSSLPRQSRLETAVWGLSLAAAVRSPRPAAEAPPPDTRPAEKGQDGSRHWNWKYGIFDPPLPGPSQ